MHWTRSMIAACSIALGVVLFFAVNIFSDVWFSSARLDLTQASLYTVSPGTRNTLKAIPEPITLRFFFSERISVKYAGVRAYGARVRDLLREYASLAGGKINLEIVDPEPLTEQEDLAVAQGVTGAPTPAGEKVYFGLVGTNMVAGREVIPFFIEDREEYLEFDITNLIYKLIREKKPALGVVSNLPFDSGLGGMAAAMQGRSRPFMIYEQIRESFDVHFLEQDFDRIPPEIDVLMVAHPKPLNDKTQYAIDQFIMRGGRALVFLDPWSEIAQVSADPMSGAPLEGSTQSSAASIEKLTKSWGVAIDPKHIIGVRDRAQQVQFAGDVVSYVAWLGFTVFDMDRKDLITGELTDLNLATVGGIKATKGATTTLSPLLQTTDDTMEIDVAKLRGSPNPDELLRDFVKSGDRFVVAGRIHGPIKSAFPAGPPPESIAPPAPDATAKPLPAHLKETKGPANIILVADSDLFNDSFWVQAQELQGQRVAVPVADNAVFVLNTIENLTGSNDLISLRSRGTSNRPFIVVNNLRRRAEQQFLQQERALQDKMTAAQNRLAELEGRRTAQARPGAPPRELLTPEQEKEIERFRGELAETRAALRDVQRRLRRDIDRLGNWLGAINILLVPLMLGGTAIVLALLRRRKQGGDAR